jgi:hypothetical protein
VEKVTPKKRDSIPITNLNFVQCQGPPAIFLLNEPFDVERGVNNIHE